MCQDEIREPPPPFRQTEDGENAAAEWTEYRRIRHDYLRYRNQLRTEFNLTAEQLDEYLSNWTATSLAVARMANALIGTRSEQWERIVNMRHAWDDFAGAQDNLVARLRDLGYANPNGVLNNAICRVSTANEVLEYYTYGDGYDIEPVR